MRLAITLRIKLAITLRYLVTGDSYRSLEFLSRVSRSTIGLFVPETLQYIVDNLKEKVMKVPNKEEEWMQIAHDFDNIWQFPHTLRALDGKHIRIKSPAHSGSYFYNFKGFHSIVLFAAVDTHSRFIFVDVGCNGKASDSCIYHDGFLYTELRKGNLNVPTSRPLNSRGNNISYFFIGDDAFALDKHLMKPYSRGMKLSVPKEMFNYRISRARMVVECAFGRLANRFRIFHRPIEVLPETADLIIMACCTLHNFLTKTRVSPVYDSTEFDITLPNTFTLETKLFQHTDMLIERGTN